MNHPIHYGCLPVALVVIISAWSLSVSEHISTVSEKALKERGRMTLTWGEDISLQGHPSAQEEAGEQRGCGQWQQQHLLQHVTGLKFPTGRVVIRLALKKKSHMLLTRHSQQNEAERSELRGMKKYTDEKFSPLCVRMCTKVLAGAMIVMGTNQILWCPSKEELNRMACSPIGNNAQHLYPSTKTKQENLVETLCRCNLANRRT